MRERQRAEKQPHPFDEICEHLLAGKPLTEEDGNFLREMVKGPAGQRRLDDFIDGSGKAFKALLQAALIEDGGPSEVDAAVEELNKQYAVVNEGGKVLVFRRVWDENFERFYYERMRDDHFKLLYANEWVATVDKKGEDVAKPLGALWIAHPNRKNYRGGVIFDPTGRPRDGVLNLFEGFGFEPKKGEWSLLKAHIREVLCRGNEEDFTYLMNWTARMFQHPEKQAEVAVVLQGGKGVGKGIFGNAVMRCAGQHGFRISSSKHLTGNFNAHLRDTILLFSDEAFYAGDKAHEGALKSLITEPLITIEGKYLPTINVRNYLHIIIASNEEWAVPVTEGERRYFVLEVSDAKKGDYSYFKKIMTQMEDGGYAAMLHELLHRDITDFNHRNVPETEGLRNQLVQGFASEKHKAFYHDALVRGSFREDYLNWEEKVETQEVYKLYCEYAKKLNERFPLTQEAFGKFMVKATGSESRRQMAGGRRFYGYHVGSLKQARQAFETWAEMKLDWPAAPPVVETGAEAMVRRKQVRLASGRSADVVVPIDEARAMRGR